mmetsp:Transcript_5450/g.12514  ORF Transcript_5450/g.12514 Transcript_5450/m.12514 type:complete len:132 (+) Transcript_5450:202-597(+)
MLFFLLPPSFPFLFYSGSTSSFLADLLVSLSSFYVPTWQKIMAGGEKIPIVCDSTIVGKKLLRRFQKDQENGCKNKFKVIDARHVQPRPRVYCTIGCPFWRELWNSRWKQVVVCWQRGDTMGWGFDAQSVS